MNVIAIGDIHGRDDWKEIVKNECDVFVFIGDYLDTHEGITPKQQADNFNEILKFKRENTDKVVLLIGNHDYHYLPNCNDRFRGFQGHMLPTFSAMLKSAIDEDLIQACYSCEGVLYSHAGFTKTWCEDNHVDYDNFQEYVNNYFLYNTSKFGFIRKGYGFGNPYGDDVFQSPLWVRPKSLHENKVDGYKQVVGHTTQDKLNISNEIAFIDVLGVTGEFLMVNDGEFV